MRFYVYLYFRLILLNEVSEKFKFQLGKKLKTT